MCIRDVIVYSIWTTSHRGFFTEAPDCGDMACWRVSVTTWAFCPIRARASRLRGGPQGSCTSTSLDALPRSSRLRETITQWDSAQNGYFDVPGIIGNTLKRRVLLKCIEWERTGSIQFRFHSWTFLQLPFRRVPYMLWPTHLSNCQLLLFCLFMMYKSKRHLCVFATCSFKQIPICNPLLSSLDLFLFFPPSLSEVA